MSMYSSGLDHMADQMAKSGKPAAALEPAVATAAGPEALAAVSAAKMRCGGCGGKVIHPRTDCPHRTYSPPLKTKPLTLQTAIQNIIFFCLTCPVAFCSASILIGQRLLDKTVMSSTFERLACLLLAVGCFR